MPRNKIEAEAVGGGGFEDGFNPVFVIGGDSGAANFEIGVAGAIDNGSGTLNVEGGVVWVFGIVPATEKVRFVPNFIINTRDVFFLRVTSGGGFY